MMSHLSCVRCGVPLEMGDVVLSYLENEFHINALRCPVCGQALISEELAKGKMREVEMLMEDK